MTVRVIVDDVNDNAPQIVFNTLSTADATIAHVRENSVSGSFVAHVTASDADSGHNALVSCVLGEHVDSDLFELVPRPFQHATHREADYQLMTSQSAADRESRWRFNVTVLCSDSGSPTALNSHRSLDVYVTDDNDNAPTFTSPVCVHTRTDDVSVNKQIPPEQFPRNFLVANTTEKSPTFSQQAANMLAICYEKVGDKLQTAVVKC